MTRIWPRAAVLIVITIYFGLVHAGEVIPGPGGGPGRTDVGNRLAQGLADFYQPGGRFAALKPEHHRGTSIVPLVLGTVLSHAADLNTTVQWKNRKLIAWAQQLVMASGQADAVTRPLLARQTARLLARYEANGPARTELMMLLDRLNLWGPEHLPFLARLAGSRNDAEAEEFGDRALITLAQVGDADVTAMVDTLRERPNEWRPAQWALLAQSGHVTDDELATLVMLIAHEFAMGDGFVEFTSSLMPGEPLREVFERFMFGLEQQDITTHSAFMMAQDESEAVGDMDSPRKHRRVFFERLVGHTLFAESAPARVVVNEKASPVAAPVVREGNVVRPKFGCQSDFAKRP